MTKHIYSIVLLSILFIGCMADNLKSGPKENENPWAFTSFEKVDSINPILKPTSSLKFECPITKQQTKREERNDLNPSVKLL